MRAAVRQPDAGGVLRAGGHALFLVLGAFLTGLLFAGATVSVLASMGFSRETDIVALLVVSSVGQFVGFYVAVWWYFQRVGDFEALVLARVPSLRDAAWAVGGLVALFLTNLVLSQLLVQFGLEGAQNAVIEQGRATPELFLYLIPVTVLFVAPAEELLFRGAVQGLFVRAAGVGPGILGSSLLFGVAHYLALGGTGSRFATIAVIVVLGLLLGAVYELSENIAVPIAVHAGWNVTVFAWEYAVVTGAV
jgi:membrane protease YdiL (CAAX protease family)